MAYTVFIIQIFTHYLCDFIIKKKIHFILFSQFIIFIVYFIPGTILFILILYRLITPMKSTFLFFNTYNLC